MKKKKKAKIVIPVVLLAVIAGFLIYFQIYYHAGEAARKALRTSGEVNVSKTDNGYFFDGPGEETALIFYPGAKVEEISYAPLLRDLADAGIDAFLVEMPFRFAFFGAGRAGNIISAYSYDKWILAGHSLGGVAASSYAADHRDKVDGVVMLASYPTKMPDDGMSFCSVYGSRDGVLNREKYGEAKKNWPAGAEEIIIEGGNHAQFGDYGEQRGDGTAAISAKEQQKQTVSAIISVFGG